MDANQRLVALAGAQVYASHLDLHLQTYGGEGQTPSVTVVWSTTQPVAGIDHAAIRFSPDRESAVYEEGGEASDSKYQEPVPYDFSESYRIADVWKGSIRSPDTAWEEFHSPEELLEFLANRLDRRQE